MKNTYLIKKKHRTPNEREKEREESITKERNNEIKKERTN